jgi:type I restriction enzyme S subunit
MTSVSESCEVAKLGRYRPYPAYKDSGVEWLGEIPAEWAALSIGSIGRFSKGSGGTKADECDNGVPCIRYGHLYTQHQFFIKACHSFIAPERAFHYTEIRHGDVLFAGSGETLDEIGKSAVNLLESEALCGGDILILRPSREVDAVFLGYATDSASAAGQKAEMGRGFTVMHIYASSLKNLKLSLPSLSEQRAIAAFLDRETAKIDALVEKQERLIELLQEKRTALITHAVTKGLDPDAPMKDSGVEWLGEVPATWEVKRLWHLTPASRKIMYGIVLPGPNVDNGVPIVKGGDVSLDGLKLERLHRTTCEIESQYERSRLKDGDLVYAIRGSIGDVEMVPAELEGANLTQDAESCLSGGYSW